MKPISPVTRLLLATDGSTTVILEALLDCALDVRVDAQEDVPPGRVPAGIAAALRPARGSGVVARKSALVAPDGTVVSVNTVHFASTPHGWSGSAQDAAPLGRRLRQAGTRQHREILASGTARWPDPRHPAPCAFKEYVIDCEGGARLHISERFNPLVIPAPQARPGHGAGAWRGTARPARPARGPGGPDRAGVAAAAVAGSEAHAGGTTPTAVVLPSLT